MHRMRTSQDKGSQLRLSIVVVLQHKYNWCPLFKMRDNIESKNLDTNSINSSAPSGNLLKPNPFDNTVLVKCKYRTDNGLRKCELSCSKHAIGKKVKLDSRIKQQTVNIECKCPKVRVYASTLLLKTKQATIWLLPSLSRFYAMKTQVKKKAQNAVDGHQKKFQK